MRHTEAILWRGGRQPVENCFMLCLGMNHLNILKSLDVARHKLSHIQRVVNITSTKLDSIESSLNDIHEEPPRGEHVDLKNMERRLGCILRELKFQATSLLDRE